ncbi:hypothetical protein [Lacipirellula limnantheis]|uniref:hypothetical protein n=1 Tax=Lacipirellula limnantheis TaxID=2528024 RepID=UPI001FE5B879|nr:hypothetical protein [Lacipirellula limnantheis]
MIRRGVEHLRCNELFDAQARRLGVPLGDFAKSQRAALAVAIFKLDVAVAPLVGTDRCHLFPTLRNLIRPAASLRRDGENLNLSNANMPQ